MEENIIDVDDETFEKEVLERSYSKPVVVDFWANWCPPCKMLGPVLEKVTKDYNSKFILAKVNVDESKDYAQKYKVMSIPSIKLIKDGEVIDEFTGVIPEENIKNWLDEKL